MAGNPIQFPNIKPTAREYSPGEFPQNIFQAQNGASVAIKFGNRRVNASLKLTFQNISDLEASRILRTYELVNGPWDYILFDDSEMNDGFVNPNDYVSGSPQSELYSVFYHSSYWKDADNGKTYPPDTDIRQYHKESGRTGKSEGPSGLKYRFSSAPVVRSVNRTTCTVTCEFTAFLDGGLD
jgi:hypothetical protein